MKEREEKRRTNEKKKRAKSLHEEKKRRAKRLHEETGRLRWRAARRREEGEEL